MPMASSPSVLFAWGDALVVPKCDLHHIVHLGRLPGLTPGVSKCHLPAKSPVSVTACSRGCDEYRPTVWRQRRPSPPSFTVSGARQYGHPGFPLFLRPPGARSISTRPRGRQAAGPRHFRVRAAFQESRVHKRRRHPEGCRLASSHGTRSNPCPFDLSPRSSPASAHESARPMQHEPCQRTGKLR